MANQSVINGVATDNVAILPGQGAVVITVGTDLTTAHPRRLFVVASAAGNVNIKLADASTMIVPVAVGLTQLDLAVKGIVASGTTATANYFGIL